MVAGAFGDGGVGLQNLPCACKGADGAVASCISNAVVAATPVALRPHEIVRAIALDHEGAFDIVLGRDLFIDLAIRHRDYMLQVVRQLGDYAMSLTAIV